MVDVKYDEFGNKIVNEVGSVTFKCPACEKIEISRTKQARAMAKEYECPKCGFIGP